MPKVKIGRNISHGGVLYGKGTYDLDARTAASMRNRKAHLSRETFIRGERQARVDREAEEAAETSDFTDTSSSSPASDRSERSSRLNALDRGLGEQSDGDDDQDESDQGAGDEGSGQAVRSVEDRRSDDEKVMALKGQLPEDFPARKELSDAGITTYEHLTGLKEADVKAIPGIKDARLEAIGNRLYRDAQNAPAK